MVNLEEILRRRQCSLFLHCFVVTLRMPFWTLLHSPPFLVVFDQFAPFLHTLPHALSFRHHSPPFPSLFRSGNRKTITVTIAITPPLPSHPLSSSTLLDAATPLPLFSLPFLPILKVQEVPLMIMCFFYCFVNSWCLMQLFLFRFFTV